MDELFVSLLQGIEFTSWGIGAAIIFVITLGFVRPERFTRMYAPQGSRDGYFLYREGGRIYATSLLCMLTGLFTLSVPCIFVWLA